MLNKIYNFLKRLFGGNKMKVSSLNRFKNKNVKMEYKNTNDSVSGIVGIVEDVEFNGITIDYGKGLQKIALDKLLAIEESDEESSHDILEDASSNLLDDDLQQNIELNGKCGIKIYKGAGSTYNNFKVSLINSIDFSKIDFVTDETVKSKLEDLSEKNEPVYAWAALTKIQKEVTVGQPIIFINVDTKEVFILEYFDEIYDSNSEIQKLVGWQGRGFENVVFMRNKIVLKLKAEQIDSIIELIDAKYKSSGGFSGYKYLPIMYPDQTIKFNEIIKR